MVSDDDEDNERTRALLSALYGFGQQDGDDPKLSKLLRHTDHQVTTHQGQKLTITSWKMQDYAYKRDPCPYPTRARGLFTRGRKQIIARAYDKFFNVDEVSWTKWTALPELSTAPYYLTLKSNGCLILVAAVSSSELLVTSKHAIGQAKQAAASSHAEVGERWLRAGLKEVGKSEEHLAAKLWQDRLTLVAELCDDSFEEHILAYPPDKTGLHLHGVVINDPALLILPPPEVNALAKQYGLIETPFIVLQSVQEIKQFTDGVAANGGMWQNEHIEGFVVRAALKADSIDAQPQPNEFTAQNVQDARRVFMWKIKFDQPYLMWREWREMTKKVLASKRKSGHDVAALGKRKINAAESAHYIPPTTNATPHLVPSPQATAKIAEVPEEESSLFADMALHEMKSGRGQASEDSGASAVNLNRIRNPETKAYLSWVQKYMNTHPEAFVNYMDNRGIVAVRNAYLEYRAQVLRNEGETSAIEQPDQADSPLAKTFDRTLIVPIAVPGCGKTMIGIALSALFGFAHPQSDNITAKKAAKHFEADVAKLLRDSSVVYADKNNHLKQHRKAMADIAKQSSLRTRMIAIVWSLSGSPQNELHRICSDRIVHRGENHQSLRPVETGEHEIILMRFFGQCEAYDPAFNADADGQFHDSIEMRIDWEFEKSLRHVIDELIRIGDIPGVHAPSPEEFRAAMTQVASYKPSIIKEMKLDSVDSSAKGGGARKGARYYGIAVEVDLAAIVAEFLDTATDLAPDDRQFFLKLWDTKLIEPRPHVTLVHEKELELAPDGSNTTMVAQAKSLWERCQNLSARQGASSITATLLIGPLLVWDGRVASLQVSSVEYAGDDVDRHSLPNDHGMQLYHITMGTLSKEIRPIEGRWLLESVQQGQQRSRGGQPISQRNITTRSASGRIRPLF